MPSYIQPTFKIATVASGCYRRWLGLFNFCGHSLLMAPTRARSLVEHWRRTSLGSKYKSSSVPIKQKALRFCPNAGSLSVRLPGSTVAGGSPKTSKTSTAMHWLSSVWRPFALWSEGYVFPDELLGRTLKGFAEFGGAARSCRRGGLLAHGSQARDVGGGKRHGFEADATIFLDDPHDTGVDLHAIGKCDADVSALLDAHDGGEAGAALADVDDVRCGLATVDRDRDRHVDCVAVNRSALRQ